MQLKPADYAVTCQSRFGPPKRVGPHTEPALVELARGIPGRGRHALSPAALPERVARVDFGDARNRLPFPLGYREEFSEVRHLQHVAADAAAVRQPHRAVGRLRALAHQRQHAQRRAVEVLDAAEVDLDAGRPRIAQRAVARRAEVAVATEVEAPAQADA